jgi:hypothetical protein
MSKLRIAAVFARRCLVVAAAALLALAGHAPGETPATYRVQLDVISKGYDGKRSWVHPRAGAIPGRTPTVVLTMQKLLLTGNDVFYASNEMRTDDLGKTWSGPFEHAETLGRRSESNGVIVAASDFWPKWHAKTGKLLGIGHTVRYLNNKAIPGCRRETCYSVYDAADHSWSPWTTLEMPDDPKFFNAGAGSVQRVDLPNGEILLPIYFKARDEKNTKATVLRCAFDGRKLSMLSQGNELALNVERGFAEPSLTRFGGRFFLTLRNDKAGYVTTSTDGLQFEKPVPWTFDDGAELGNYNTQQHWVTHSDGLFLVYTRRGANNDHVFRNRAPLFMAQVDPKRVCVIRSSERILLPDKGAQYGNFGTVNVSPGETWVTDAEGMQGDARNPYDIARTAKRGADNRVYAARIIWDEPNNTWNRH